ncbi:hypothetical protein IE53DRAFT_385902 [Violaceomyces palustris]|uniref:Uncharacterized protein n=1 Tax=Violaceomyces palustris TaxID=1673888 RepID=A0ACD0P163_9BASI|nr:hypothetical protein IE53DRAFT_385902 [Violaceomyces palustris]
MPSNAGKAVLIIGTIIFFHAAYSTYEHLSLLKSLDLPTGAGSASSEGHGMPKDIAIETIVSLLVILVGVSLTAQPLKEITWTSEMRKRTIDELDSRPNFSNLNHRGSILFGKETLS